MASKLKLKVNCGCGYTDSEDGTSAKKDGVVATGTTDVRKVLIRALEHAEQTGHGMEIRGLIKQEITR